ncbi:hypothetical protein [Saccharomonospora iraqiensis]|uniref:hypothetical protein n=1 Tax=Saccharomonospora iraqiensis TaxID=52698 RepID=UPI0004188890|nr:hypothetical protein [Saccharomonospora iraqiensis]
MAGFAGLSVNSARNALTRLADAGLAWRDENRPARFTVVDATDEDLDRVAGVYGKAGRLARLSEQVTLERLGYSTSDEWSTVVDSRLVGEFAPPGGFDPFAEEFADV